MIAASQITVISNGVADLFLAEVKNGSMPQQIKGAVLFVGDIARWKGDLLLESL